MVTRHFTCMLSHGWMHLLPSQWTCERRPRLSSALLTGSLEAPFGQHESETSRHMGETECRRESDGWYAETPTLLKAVSTWEGGIHQDETRLRDCIKKPTSFELFELFRCLRPGRR